MTHLDIPLKRGYMENGTKCPSETSKTANYNKEYLNYRGITVAQLLKDKESEGWDSKNQVLNIWFCGPVGNTCAENQYNWSDDIHWWDIEISDN